MPLIEFLDLSQKISPELSKRSRDLAVRDPAMEFITAKICARGDYTNYGETRERVGLLSQQQQVSKLNRIPGDISICRSSPYPRLILDVCRDFAICIPLSLSLPAISRGLRLGSQLGWRRPRNRGVCPSY